MSGARVLLGVRADRTAGNPVAGNPVAGGPVVGSAASEVMREAGLVAAAAVALLVVIVSVGLWAARHPVWVHARGARLLAWSPVARLRRRYRRECGFLQRRLAPGPAAGLTLTVAVAAVAGLGAVFAVLLDGVLDGEGVAVLDHPVVEYLAARRIPALTGVVLVITDAGSPVAVAVLALAVSAATAVIARSWSPLVIGALGAAGMSLINIGVKALVGRSRPGTPWAVIVEDGFSFPSGHTTGTTVVGLLSAWMLCRWVVHRWAAQVAVAASAVLYVGAVGLSRVYLGVHFPSDVLAGWALGVAWVISVVLVFTVWHDRGAAAAPAQDAPGPGGGGGPALGAPAASGAEMASQPARDAAEHQLGRPRVG